MKFYADRELLLLFAGILGLLVLGSVIGAALGRTVKTASGKETVENLNARIRAWWAMSAVFALTLAAGPTASLVLFAGLSFVALREFITLVPSHRADHRALFWAFFIFTPLQYFLISKHWSGASSMAIPVGAFLLIATRCSLEGDTEQFLERTAKIFWGLMLCVYLPSHAPALLMLKIPGYAGQSAKLLMFLVVVSQMSDVLQYVWGKLAGRRKIAPRISPGKTWEGFLGGVGCAVLIGAGLWWATPFGPGAAAAMALVIALLGFVGGLVMSAIKRDSGVKDFGSSIQGHGGFLDRLDSLCFSAPVFFYLTRYFYA